LMCKGDSVDDLDSFSKSSTSWFIQDTISGVLKVWNVK
jgi:hypothetical protein